ncbi:MAG: type II toxin-antitoxin system RelE/ParE family toxin [Duganella sp.]
MKEYTVVFTPEAQQQLVELYRYIAEKTTVDTALRYINAVTDYCDGMKMFPHRGTQRNDHGLRINI